MYTVPSSAATYTSLLPDFLPPRQSLPHTVVIITLDWTRPWTFIEELQMWLVWVEQWAKADGSRELEIVREEQRERCTCFLTFSLIACQPQLAISTVAPPTLYRTLIGTPTDHNSLKYTTSVGTGDIHTQHRRGPHPCGLYKGGFDR